jgi:hypothetical protein
VEKTVIAYDNSLTQLLEAAIGDIMFLGRIKYVEKEIRHRFLD